MASINKQFSYSTLSDQKDVFLDVKYGATGFPFLGTRTTGITGITRIDVGCYKLAFADQFVYPINMTATPVFNGGSTINFTQCALSGAFTANAQNIVFLAASGSVTAGVWSGNMSVCDPVSGSETLFLFKMGVK